MRGSRYLRSCIKIDIRWLTRALILIVIVMTYISMPFYPAYGKGKHKVNLERGRQIYNKYCYYCHGREGRGDGAIAIGLTPRPANFVDDVERMKKPDEVLFQSIAKGIHRKGSEAMVMPEWDLILTEQDIWDVLGYVRYLSKKGREKARETK